MSSEQAIAYLNAQRSRNGIPAGIVERPEWSDGCVKHAAYIELNGGGIDFSNPHDEDPSMPGYTPQGQAAARSAVLGGTYSTEANPWEGAPIHLMQLLGPQLAETGYGPGCMWTWPGYTRSAPQVPATYSYPGPGTTIYPTYRAAEWPFTPGEFVGLPQGTTTGPYLYVFAFAGSIGPVTLTSATLSGPGGPMEVRLVDNHTADARGDVGSYLPSGGIVIPVNALDPSTEYHAAVDGHASTWAATVGMEEVVPLRWDWTFRTEAVVDPPEPPAAAKVKVKAKSSKSKLFVDVNPNKGPRYWKFKVKKKRSDGSWRSLKTYKTKGKKETRLINLQKGTYRVEVKPKFGYEGVTSKAVRLRR